ncbi:Gfo/Idh/MocA family oxidoreductase [uncultured Clostridium sp.]|jgi:predicted dehydrogenase|uniref:Gfo/Idh/MocA family protein n=1 Tax=uncultured Clostridium sp. TaxID=59620 RepID=UPI0026272BB8|nr:Gfo/Idh/MocA family oxidoreductase [uncultured Clostridium sp.]
MKKVRFGIIGTSKITEQFLQAGSTHNKFELIAVYSRDIEKAKSFGEKYNAKLFFDDIEKFTTSNEFDAVYIASPNTFHYRQSIVCMKGKKHVLCEKAFAISTQEAKNMIKVARENNVLLTEAMRSTTSKGFIEFKRNLYKIGEVRRYFASFCQYSSRYDAYKKGIVENIFKKEMGAGALMDIGVYTIAPMVNLFGIPSSILANSYMLKTGADGKGSAIFDYGEFDGMVSYSKISNSSLGVEVQGENGVIVANNILFEDVKIIYKDGKIEELYKESLDNNMFYEIDDFIRNINDGKLDSILNPLDNSLEVIEILEKIRRQTNIEF